MAPRRPPDPTERSMTPGAAPIRAGGHSNPPLALEVPAELVEAVAQRAAELLAGRLDAGPERHLDVAGAAQHLACPASRIYALVSAGRIPVRRDGSRLLFRASELDDWLDRGGGVRP